MRYIYFDAAWLPKAASIGKGTHDACPRLLTKPLDADPMLPVADIYAPGYPGNVPRRNSRDQRRLGVPGEEERCGAGQAWHWSGAQGDRCYALRWLRPAARGCFSTRRRLDIIFFKASTSAGLADFSSS